MKILEINDMVKYIENAPVEMNLLFIGDTGVGKTTVIKNYCKDNGIYLKTIILSQIDASECLGIPVRSKRIVGDKEYDTLTTAVPDWVFDLKEHEDSAILFLDEFLCAQPSVMNSFLNFLTEKNVNGIDLSKVRVVAATNIGNYTFSPDNNILSRFCMFYVENNSAGDFIKENRIKYSYKDENVRSGVIFEPRSLKPRCFEQISKVKDNDLFYDYYEGFTNVKYFNICDNEEINEVLRPYFKMSEEGLWEISDSNVAIIKSILSSKFKRIKSWTKIIASFTNLTLESFLKIKNEFCPEENNSIKEKTKIDEIEEEIENLQKPDYLD